MFLAALVILVIAGLSAALAVVSSSRSGSSPTATTTPNNCTAFLAWDGWNWSGWGLTDKNGRLSGTFTGDKNTATTVLQHGPVTMTFENPRIPGASVTGTVNGKTETLSDVNTDDCALAKGVIPPTPTSYACGITFDAGSYAWQQDHAFVFSSPLTAGDEIDGNFSGLVTGSPHGWDLSFNLPKMFGSTTATLNGITKITLTNVGWWCYPQYGPTATPTPTATTTPTGEYLVSFYYGGHVWQSRHYLTSLHGGQKVAFGALDERWTLNAQLPDDLTSGETNGSDTITVLSSIGAGVASGTTITVSTVQVVNLQG